MWTVSQEILKSHLFNHFFSVLKLMHTLIMEDGLSKILLIVRTYLMLLHALGGNVCYVKVVRPDLIDLLCAMD